MPARQYEKEERALEASEPFLAPRAEAADVDDDDERMAQRPPTRRNWIRAGLSHAAVALLSGLITGFLAYARRNSSCPLSDRVATSLAPDLHFQQTVFHNLSSHQTPYAGPAPDAGIDAAWKQLLDPMNMRVTKAELDASGNTASVALPEGGGYLAWTGAYHELHCIKMLREWIYRDHYHADKAGEELAHLSTHADHCIEMLRQSSTCHADLSLTTFRWDAKKSKPMFDASESIHTCVDWTALQSTMHDRVVPDDEVYRLKNPLVE